MKKIISTLNNIDEFHNHDVEQKPDIIYIFIYMSILSFMNMLHKCSIPNVYIYVYYVYCR